MTVAEQLAAHAVDTRLTDLPIEARTQATSADDARAAREE
jgi:hypothetical protein